MDMLTIQATKIFENHYNETKIEDYWYNIKRTSIANKVSRKMKLHKNDYANAVILL